MKGASPRQSAAFVDGVVLTCITRDPDSMADRKNWFDECGDAVDRKHSGCRKEPLQMPTIYAGFALCTLAMAGCGDSRSDAGPMSDFAIPESGVPVIHNTRAGVWDSAETWRVEEQLRIGNADGSEKENFHTIWDIAVDATKRIYVLDRTNEIRVFDENGEYVRSIGRQGHGPGELWGPIGMGWDAEGNLWVADPGNVRWTVFDTAGRYRYGHHRPIVGATPPTWPGGFHVDGYLYDVSVQILDEASTTRGVLIRFDAELLTPVDTIPLPLRHERYIHRTSDGGVFTAMVPFAAYAIWRLDPRGYLWYGLSDRYRIFQRRIGGQLVRVIDLPVDRIPVSYAEKRAALETSEFRYLRSRGAQLPVSRIPNFQPAFETMWADESGYLWVRPKISSSDSGRVLDVFDPAGQYLGRATLDFRLAGKFGSGNTHRRVIIRGDNMYGTVLDSLGVEYIVRGRIVRCGTCERF